MSRKVIKNKITTEEKLKAINSENIDLVKDFLRAKKRTCSDATIKIYKSNLDIFFCWLVDHGNDFYLNVKKRIVSAFFTFIQEELQVNARRFAHYKSTLSELSSFIIKTFEDSEIDEAHFRNFINDVIETPVKQPTLDRVILTDEDCEKLFKYFEEKDRIQEACLFALGIYSGCRISELIQIMVDDFDNDRLGFGDLFYKTRVIRTKGRSGGKMIPRFVIKSKFDPYLTAWLERRSERLKELGVEDHGYLFINREGLPVSKDSIYDWTKRWGRVLNNDLHPHVMRHYFTTLLQKQGISDTTVQKILQWSSVDLVQLYSDLDPNEVDEEELDLLKNALQ